MTGAGTNAGFNPLDSFDALDPPAIPIPTAETSAP